VKLDPPVLVSVSDRDRLLLTVTLPKPRLAGVDPRVPTVTPVPDTGIVIVSVAVSRRLWNSIATLPLLAVADWG
jgi:hypothetical protein